MLYALKVTLFCTVEADSPEQAKRCYFDGEYEEEMSAIDEIREVQHNAI